MLLQLSVSLTLTRPASHLELFMFPKNKDTSNSTPATRRVVDIFQCADASVGVGTGGQSVSLRRWSLKPLALAVASERLQPTL